MKIAVSSLALLVASAFGQPAPQATAPNTPQTTAAKAPDAPVIRSTAQEVVLDLIVRDKKGHVVRDLQPNEIEVTDDGAPQQIKSFRLVGSEPETAGSSKAKPASVTAAPSLDPLRQVRLVTMVFEHLGQDGRNLSRSAALDFLKNESGPNLYFGVFSIDQRLSVLQQYTSDKEAVKKAVTRACSADYSLFSDESEKIATELKILAAQDVANNTPQASGQAAATNNSGPQVAMAQMTLNMLQFSQAMERTQQGRASIFSLLSLIREQNRLPGRKTLMYFTEGLYVPPNLADVFQSIIGTANRANVSVYAIDAKGLVTYGQNNSSGSMLQEAANSSASQQNNRGGPVRPDQARSLDLAEESMRANTTNSLADLSAETGGFLISNTNDLRTPLKRIAEDVNSYYELSYTPQIDNFDGHFRRIAVKLTRPDLRVQTRTGYFALPALQHQNLFPYEMPMLNALASAQMPRNIPFHSAGLHYRTESGGPESEVVIDVPLSGITFDKDEAKASYRAHLSVLAMFKNSEGAIVHKMSQDVPAIGPLDKLENFKAGHFIYTQHADLPPGHYTLETAVLDRETLKVGAKRLAVMVPAPAPGVSISSLALVRSVSQEPGQTADPDDPFKFSGGKITPALDDRVKGGPGSQLSVYFIVYPQAGSADTPELTVDFLEDGKVIARGQPKLPPADSKGRIPYIATSPIETLKPGQYIVRATVKQGANAVAQRTFVTIE